MPRSPTEVEPDRRDDAARRPRRFHLRIRDWLIAVVLVALVAAGMAQVIRGRRLRIERELAETLQWQQILRKQEVLNKEMIRLEEEINKLDDGERTRQLEASPKSSDGIFPDPDRRGLPDDGRTVLQDQ